MQTVCFTQIKSVTFIQSKDKTFRLFVLSQSVYIMCTVLVKVYLFICTAKFFSLSYQNCTHNLHTLTKHK